MPYKLKLKLFWWLASRRYSWLYDLRYKKFFDEIWDKEDMGY